MDFQTLAEARRSVRSYVENTVMTKEEMETILRCAQEAPSWKTPRPVVTMW